MLDSLFNTELPLVVKLVVAFAIVLLLLTAVMWIFKRFAGDRLGASTPRGRQPRLAVIDAATVDGRRRLVLIRRDNVEHLVMIGGPTDVLIEQNIVRAVPVAPSREAPVVRPVNEAQPAPQPARAPAPVPASEPPRPPVEAGPRPDRPERPLPRPARAEQPPPRRAADLDRLRPETAPPLSPRQPISELRPARPSSARFDQESSPAEVHSMPPAPDAGLTSMAQKLENALRRPAAKPADLSVPPRDVTPAQRDLPAAQRDLPTSPRDAAAQREIPLSLREMPAPLSREHAPSSPRDQQTSRESAPRPAPAIDPAPPALSEPPPPMAPDNGANASNPLANPLQSDIKSPSPSEKAAAKSTPAAADASKSTFDSLEEEMASLLGRGSETPEKK